VTDLLVENFRGHFRFAVPRANLEEEFDGIEEAQRSGRRLAGFLQRLGKISGMRKSIWRTASEWRSPRMEKCELSALHWYNWGKHGCSLGMHLRQEESESCKLQRKNPIALQDLDTADGRRRRLKKIGELRPRDGLKARSVWTVHGLHRLQGFARPRGGRSGEEGSRYSASMNSARRRPHLICGMGVMASSLLQRLY